jgi:hypothetical protein
VHRPGVTWSLRLREEHGLKVFENRMLRKIIRPKREEEKSKNIENYIMSSFMVCATHQILLAGTIKQDEMGGSYSMYGERTNAYMVLLGKAEGNRQLKRPRCRC